MPTEEKITQNLKKCPRFDRCSINVCPLDCETHFKIKLPKEDCCPFTIKKRVKGQKGARTLIPGSILKVIPKSNLKMLNKASWKRWYGLYKKDGKE